VQDLPGPRLCPMGTGNPLAAAMKLDFPAPVVPSTRIARQACGGGCPLDRYVSRWHRKRIQRAYTLDEDEGTFSLTSRQRALPSVRWRVSDEWESLRDLNFAEESRGMLLRDSVSS
jgi:hypothetical protein